MLCCPHTLSSLQHVAICNENPKHLLGSDEMQLEQSTGHEQPLMVLQATSDTTNILSLKTLRAAAPTQTTCCLQLQETIECYPLYTAVAHIHSYMHVHVRMYTCARMHTHMHTHTRVRTRTYRNTLTKAHTPRTHGNFFVHECTYHTLTNTHLPCKCAHTHTHTHAHALTHTSARTHTHATHTPNTHTA